MALDLFLFSKTAHEVTTRILQSEDAAGLRRIRLQAMQHEGIFKGPMHDHEMSLSRDQWAERCQATEDKAVFGLFHKKTLIGTVLARRLDRDISGKTAFWSSDFVTQKYRNQGLARDLYRARFTWTQEHPTFKHALLYIRADNERSQAIHIKHGAKLMKTKKMAYPGLPAMLCHCYVVPIPKPR